MISPRRRSRRSSQVVRPHDRFWAAWPSSGATRVRSWRLSMPIGRNWNTNRARGRASTWLSSKRSVGALCSAICGVAALSWSIQALQLTVGIETAIPSATRSGRNLNAVWQAAGIVLGRGATAFPPRREGHSLPSQAGRVPGGIHTAIPTRRPIMETLSPTRPRAIAGIAGSPRPSPRNTNRNRH